MAMPKDIAEYLEDQSVGTVGTNIFVGQMPDAPDECIAVMIYGGTAPDEVTEDMESPGLQVLIRCAKDDFADGLTLAYSVFNALHGVTDTTIESTYYYRISANQSPAQMGVDGNDRPLFVINFTVLKEVN